MDHFDCHPELVNNNAFRPLLGDGIQQRFLPSLDVLHRGFLAAEGGKGDQ